MAYQKDISAILGLSISTVSKALKGYPDVSEDTRRRVLETAKDLDYRSGRNNSMGFPSRLTGAVGVLAPEFDRFMESLYYREMICGMAAEASRNKKDLVIMGNDPEECGMSIIGKAADRKVDGICLLLSREDLYNGRFAELLESSIPIISAENDVAGHTVVCRDRRGDAVRLLEYLRDRGYRKTVHIGDLSLDSRKTGAVLGEEAKRLEMSCMEIGEDGLRDAARLTEQEASCVIFETYTKAREAIGIWRRSGKRIPDDISAAVLETELTENRAEEITGLRCCPRTIGKTAIRKLITIVEHPEADNCDRVLVSGTIHEGITVKGSGVNYTRNN